MNTGKPKGPVVFDLEDDAPGKTQERLTPATAPVIADADMPAPSGQAMRTLAGLAARKPSRVTGFFWSALLSLLLIDHRLARRSEPRLDLLVLTQLTIAL